MTVTLILAIILICIKVTHFVIIERPLKQCRIVSAYHLTVDTNGAQIDQSWLFEKDDLTYICLLYTSALALGGFGVVQAVAAALGLELKQISCAVPALNGACHPGLHTLALLL